MEGRSVTCSTGANALGIGGSSVIQRSIENGTDNNNSCRVGVSGKKRAIFTSMTLKSEGADV